MTSCTSLPGDGERPAAVRSTLKNQIRHPLLVLLFYSFLFASFFSPALFSNHLLAPGDGLIYYLPNFYAARDFWDPLILSGFPRIADSQVMTWYPPAVAFSVFSFWPNAWNLFVISAYILASCFAYGYTYSLTGSRLASLVSGIVYGMSGIMVAHLGHVTIIHTAVWLPLILWSLETGRRAPHTGSHTWWFAVGTISVACAALAGHPQILLYILVLAAAYVLLCGWTEARMPWRYFGLSLLMVFLGLGLAAIQLLPTMELTGLTPRVQFSFADFVSYSLPLRQVPTLLLPLIFGGAPESFYGQPYFGAWPAPVGGWGPGEPTAYVGLLPIMLAIIGVVAWTKKRVTFFWSVVAMFAFVLTLGDATSLAALTYRLPAINRFRAPSRHFIEMAFAISVLSGLGVAAIKQAPVTKRLLQRSILIVAGFFLVCLVAVYLMSDRLHELAAGRGINDLKLLPWTNPAIGVPIAVLLTTAGILIYWYRSPNSYARSALLLLILVLDLASFSWFGEWRDKSAQKDLLSPPTFASRYKNILDTHHQRMLPVRGSLGTVNEIIPNLSRLWNVPSASGY
nr:hypothetical protein [Pyrinomonadaceae bacterium]